MNLLKPLWMVGHKRAVSTWSPLATAFNTRPNSRPVFDSLRERTVSIFSVAFIVGKGVA